MSGEQQLCLTPKRHLRSWRLNLKFTKMQKHKETRRCSTNIAAEAIMQIQHRQNQPWKELPSKMMRSKIHNSFFQNCLLRWKMVVGYFMGFLHLTGTTLGSSKWKESIGRYINKLKSLVRDPQLMAVVRPDKTPCTSGGESSLRDGQHLPAVKVALDYIAIMADSEWRGNSLSCKV